MDISVSASLTFGDRYVASVTSGCRHAERNRVCWNERTNRFGFTVPCAASHTQNQKCREDFSVSTFDFEFPSALQKLPYNFPNSQGFFYEARAVTLALQQGRVTALEEYPHEESLLCARITDAMRKELKCD